MFYTLRLDLKSYLSWVDHRKSETPSTSSGLKKSKRTAHDDFLEDNWDCPVCTFKNPRNLYKCKVSLV